MVNKKSSSKSSIICNNAETGQVSCKTELNTQCCRVLYRQPATVNSRQTNKYFVFNVKYSRLINNVVNILYLVCKA